jgi:DNA-binding phage protein
MAETRRSVFWDDLDGDLADSEFRRQFVLEQNRIATTDRIVNLLIAALEESGLTRAAVARAVDSHASAIRRLLNREAKGTNPTLETLSNVAAVLGFQVALVPMSARARKKVTDPLVSAANRPKRPDLVFA